MTRSGSGKSAKGERPAAPAPKAGADSARTPKGVDPRLKPFIDRVADMLVKALTEDPPREKR